VIDRDNAQGGTGLASADVRWLCPSGKAAKFLHCAQAMCSGSKLVEHAVAVSFSRFEAVAQIEQPSR
jgi:hypothetical protein